MTDEVHAFLTLVFTLAVLTAAIIAALLVFGHVPVLGTLPGDLTIPLAHGSLTLPFGSSIVTALIVTAVAWLATAGSRRTRNR